MKKFSVIALVSVGVVVLLTSLGFWLRSEINKTRSELALIRKHVEAQGTATTAVLERLNEKATAVDGDPVVGEMIELRTAGDIQERIDQLAPDAGIEQVAVLLSEMDQWFYHVEDEAAAREKLAAVTHTLRRLIEERIRAELESALQAGNGHEATGIMTRVNDLLALYPSPVTSEEQEQLFALTGRILRATQRVEEIRRLRYNAWAVSKIEGGRAAYEQAKGRIFTNDGRLVSACVQHLAEIDPAYLEPVALDLYNYVIGLTAQKVNDESRVRLARGFADPATSRKTPADF